MILPIVAFGNNILKKEGISIDACSEETQNLIANMYETMDHCKGVGLAAPQINKSFKLFVIDSAKADNDEDKRKSNDEKGLRMAFINPIMIEEYGKMVAYEEGCLSIPGVYGEVSRCENVKIEYTNEKGERKIDDFSGFTARVIQHEYDHIMGKLFVEKLTPLKKQMIKKKLESVRLGKINLRYKMIFA